MPNYYYCRQGGTCTDDTGRSATQLTGTWASNFSGVSEYYADPYDIEQGAPTTAPVKGDVIVWCKDSTPITFSVDELADDLPEGVLIITVDESDIAVYSKATTSLKTPSVDAGPQTEFHSIHRIEDASMLKGLYWKNGGTLYVGDEQAGTFWIDCRFEELRRSSYSILNHDYGCLAFFLDCLLEGKAGVGGTSAFYDFSTGGSAVCIGNVHDWEGDAIQGTISGRSGGAHHFAEDYSACSSGCALVEFTSASYDNGHAVFHRCDLPDNWTVANGSGLEGLFNSVLVIACDSKYQYEFHNGYGTVSFETTHYHADDDTLDDGTSKGSWHFDPDTNVGDRLPLLFGITTVTQRVISGYNDNASNNKCRIAFGSDTALDGHDIVAICQYVNTTGYQSSVVYIWELADWETATTFGTESGKWTSGTPSITNQYTLDLTMTSNGVGEVNVIFGLRNSSANVFVSPQLRFVT